MELSGIIKGGVVVPDLPLGLPEGTRVRIEVDDKTPGQRAWVDEFAGCVEDMPEDASVNYHQRLYGTRER